MLHAAQASKLVADMNLDAMQELQEREENDPEFAAHNAAVRQHRRLMEQLREQERLENEAEKPQEFFSPATLWVQCMSCLCIIRFSTLTVLLLSMQQDEPTLYNGDQEEESDSDDYDEDMSEDMDDGSDGEGSADSSAHADTVAPAGSVFSMIVDTVSASELPEMPKISFAMKPSAPPAPDVDASTGSAGGAEPEDVEADRATEPAPTAEPAHKKSDPAVLTSRLSVVPDPNRLWSSFGKSKSSSSSQHEPVALTGHQTRRYFDKVDEEVDLEADPILRQVAMNKANPGLAQGGNSMKDVLARITKPFEEMAANRSKSAAQTGISYASASTPTSPHYGELPHSTVHSQQTVMSVASSLMGNCLVLVKLFFGAVAGFIGYVFPFLKQILAHLVVVAGRFSVACSAQRNGEFVPVSMRFSSAGWCMWAHLSSRNGLGMSAACLSGIQMY